MNTKELIQTIKDEKLYDYYPFSIGHPYAPGNIGIEAMGSCCEGIYEDENGNWRAFDQNDRGGITEYPNKYTEAEACQYLLEFLRHHKRTYPKHKIQWGCVINPELWWDEPSPE